VSDQTTRGAPHVTRRAALASFMWLVVGCASTSRGAIARLQATRISFLAPDYAPELRMETGDWPALDSAATIERERARASARFRRWHEVAVPSFADALVSALRGHGVAVDRLTDVMSPDRSPSLPFVRCFLSAGFVYKTLTSSTYAPFVSGVLGVWDPNGVIVYRKLYVASDRSINLFITRLPPATPLLLDDVASLDGDPEPGLNAFRLLAQQLGEKFAADLLA